MKTLEQLYSEVIQSEELKKEFAEAAKAKETLEAFLKAHECAAGIGELQAFLKNKAIVDVSDEEIDTVAGGKSGEDLMYDVLFSTTVIGCVIGPVMSEVYKSEGMDTRCILED